MTLPAAACIPGWVGQKYAAGYAVKVCKRVGEGDGMACDELNDVVKVGGR